MKLVVLATGLLLAATQPVSGPLWATEADETKKVQELVSAQRAAEAEEAFQAAIKAYPDSAAIKSLHVQLYLVHLRAGKPAEAALHATAYLEYQLALLARDPPIVFGLPNAASMAAYALDNSGEGEQGIEKFDAAIAAVEARISDGDRPELATALRDLRSNKIMLLVNTGKAIAAAKLVQAELASATEEFEAAPDEVSRVIRLAKLLQFEMSVAAQIAPETSGRLREKYAEFITGQIKKHPDNVNLVSTYNHGAIQAVRDVMSSDPHEAQKRLDNWKTFLNTLDTSASSMQNQVERGKRMIVAYEKSLVSEQKRTELAGTPAGAAADDDDK